MKRFLTAFILLLVAAPAGFAAPEQSRARAGDRLLGQRRRRLGSLDAPACLFNRRALAGRALRGRSAPHSVRQQSHAARRDAARGGYRLGRPQPQGRAAFRADGARTNALVIDRFFETKQQALGWARRNPSFMFVRVSPPDFRASPLSRTKLGVSASPATSGSRPRNQQRKLKPCRSGKDRREYAHRSRRRYRIKVARPFCFDPRSVF